MDWSKYDDFTIASGSADRFNSQKSTLSLFHVVNSAFSEFFCPVRIFCVSVLDYNDFTILTPGSAKSHNFLKVNSIAPSRSRFSLSKENCAIQNFRVSRSEFDNFSIASGCADMYFSILKSWPATKCTIFITIQLFINIQPGNANICDDFKTQTFTMIFLPEHCGCLW